MAGTGTHAINPKKRKKEKIVSGRDARILSCARVAIFANTLNEYVDTFRVRVISPKTINATQSRHQTPTVRSLLHCLTISNWSILLVAT